VTLTVTDNSGAPDSDFTIALIAASELPVADPDGPYIGRLGTPVSFDGTGSSDPDGTIATYEWDFGDKTPIVSGPTPSHTYEVPWQYPVTLTVTDNSGESASTTTTATIGIGNLPPLAEAGTPTIGSDSMTRNFDGSQSVDLNVGGSIVDWSWDFGDGASGSGETTSHTYTSAGNFNVTLTVTNDGDKTDSDNTLAIIEGDNTPPDCSLARPSIDTIWPPNLTMVQVDVLGVFDPDGNAVSITFDSIFQDEPVGIFPDGRLIASPQSTTGDADRAEVRAQRRSRRRGGNGRVYHIGFTADDGRRGSCSGEVVVKVPRRSRIEAIDDGPIYDSTVSSLQ
jgi:PKD repeat protein